MQNPCSWLHCPLAGLVQLLNLSHDSVIQLMNIEMGVEVKSYLRIGTIQ